MIVIGARKNIERRVAFYLTADVFFKGEIMMKPVLLAFALFLSLGTITLPVSAEETAPTSTGQAYQPDPTLTNRKADYPAPQEVLPPIPTPPAEGLKDVKGFMAYGKALDAYVKAAQTYIDGAANDANDIIEKRNEAAKAAQDAVNQYNAFLDQNAKK